MNGSTSYDMQGSSQPGFITPESTEGYSSAQNQQNVLKTDIDLSELSKYDFWSYFPYRQCYYLFSKITIQGFKRTKAVMSAFLCLGLLTKAISEAHMRTCLYTQEQIEQMRTETTPFELIHALKGMVCLNRYLLAVATLILI